MILVSTTVIEVGINIPSATLMIIEDANRFGLSNLPTSESQEITKSLYFNSVNLSETSKRLIVLKQTSDGFEIAERDYT